jgi:hypothetical protein
VTRYSTLKLLLLLATATAIPATLARDWKALEEDDLHDRSNPAVGILQEPEEALSVLAPDSAGNKVNWVEAIRQGQIKPRASLYGDNPVRQTLFRSVRDGNAISMERILEGEFCGVCHGAVSFPLTECNRCHSVLRDAVPASISGAVVPKE